MGAGRSKTPMVAEHLVLSSVSNSSRSWIISSAPRSLEDSGAARDYVLGSKVSTDGKRETGEGLALTSPSGCRSKTPMVADTLPPCFKQFINVPEKLERYSQSLECSINI